MFNCPLEGVQERSLLGEKRKLGECWVLSTMGKHHNGQTENDREQGQENNDIVQGSDGRE